MFTAQEIKMISRKYFRIINIEENVIVLESKNTLHRWHIYRPENKYQHVSSCILYHAHENQGNEYHKHGYYNNFSDALCDIKNTTNFRSKNAGAGKRPNQVEYSLIQVFCFIFPLCI